MQQRLIVTYHYIREHSGHGVVGVTPRQFAQHVRAIRSQYDIVGLEDFQAWRTGDGPAALITFDDALHDQQVAADILRTCQAPAVFFAPMRPYSDLEDRWCMQHLLHALAEKLGFVELERRLAPALAALEIDEQDMHRRYHYEAPHKRRLKYAAAFALAPERVRELLTAINREVGLSSDDWYLSLSQLQALQRAGHVIGGHGFDHLPYSNMSADEQRRDMQRAQGLKTQLLGAAQRPLSLPFGAETSETRRIAADCGYTACFGSADRVDAMDLEKVLHADALRHAAPRFAKRRASESTAA